MDKVITPFSGFDILPRLMFIPRKRQYQLKKKMKLINLKQKLQSFFFIHALFVYLSAGNVSPFSESKYIFLCIFTDCSLLIPCMF